MDIYSLSVVAGGVGLAAMAATGLGRHGSGHSTTGAHGHGGFSGHGHGTAHGGVAHGSAGGHGHGLAGHAASHAASWMLMSPRFLFAGLIGFGVAGVVARSWLTGPLLLVVAIAGAVACERLLVAPLWNFALRFASNPAITLDAAITSEAVAVTNFDRNGQGIVAVEVDGHVQQLLATLLPDQLATGQLVRAGQRVRIEDVDGARNRVSVSLL